MHCSETGVCVWVCVHVGNFKAEDFTGVGRCPQRILEGAEYYRLLFAGHIETGVLIIPSFSLKNGAHIVIRSPTVIKETCIKS